VNKTIWYIVIFGILGVFVLVLGMTLSIEGLPAVDAGKHVKLAETVRAQFQFQSASVGVSLEGAKKFLWVGYQASKSANFDLSAQNREMEAVADFTTANYPGTDKSSIQEIRVTRNELRGRGCWQRTDVARFAKENPFPPAGPFPIRRP